MIDDALLERLRAPAAAALPAGLGAGLPCAPAPRIMLCLASDGLCVGYICTTCGMEGPNIFGFLGPTAVGTFDDALAQFTETALGGGCGGRP